MNSFILFIAGYLLVQASSAENSAGGAGTKKKSSSKSKGLVLAKGGFGNKKINVSSIASAQAAGVEILHALPDSSGKETFVPKNSSAKHMRYGQQIHGMDVEGASLYVHVDKFGTVVGVNGEIVDETSVPSIPTIDAGMAIEAALNESRVPADEHDNCSLPMLTVVRGLMDGEAHLAWTCTVRYDILGEDGYLKPFNDQIFARATGGNPGLIQIHPKIYGARSLETRNCKQTTTTCPIASTSPNKIVLPSDLPIEAAHNYAIDTYDYYWQKHGRDSIDNNGMKLISLVHYDKNINNAFWDGTKMMYGDGDGIEFGPLSLAVDVVAHELTHGVTQYTSGLIYHEESGALNEALSDIFSAFVESFLGSNDSDIWLIGEDAWTPWWAGDALRYMCDPAAAGHSDYYPDRYQGTADEGGVHTNSGIANLAACLLAKGGTHPRGKTPGVIVPAIGYDALESIFYKANTECLTPSSNFAAARWCTAEVFGGSNKDNVHLGWDAVGVPNDPPPPSPAPTPFTVDSSGTGTFTNQEATTGELHQYTMPIREGLTVTCSTVGSNGDADLYVRFGSEAFPNQYNTVNACASATATSNESCTTSGAPSGGTTVYAGIHAFESYTGLKVTCKENPPPPTWKPTWKPTKIPTMKPTGSSPTRKPSIKPTMNQLTSKPITKMPTTKPTSKNQQQPTRNPTTKPTSKNQQPTRKPSKSPTLKPTTAVARVTLQTPICAECYLYYGNMFDVKAKRYVSIKSLTMVIQTGAVAEVWTRAGTHVGFEEALAGWTKVAEHDFTTTLPGTFATIPESSFSQPINIPAGSTQALYITLRGADLGGIDGMVYMSKSDNPTSTVSIEDNNLIIYAGKANRYFLREYFVGYNWNGALIYAL